MSALPTLPAAWRAVVAEHPVVLFTRQGCHLCDQAATQLAELGLPVHPVDIDTDEQLRAAFGDDVPVIAAGGRVVCRWRLDVAAVRAALADPTLL